MKMAGYAHSSLNHDWGRKGITTSWWLNQGGSPLGCPRKLGSKVIGSVGEIITPMNPPFVSRLKAIY